MVALEAPRRWLAPTVAPVEDLHAGRTDEWADLGLRAGLAVPVLAGSVVVGVIEFFTDEPLPADPELLELLLSVGTQLGRVVERQRSEEARLRALVDNMPANVYLRDLEREVHPRQPPVRGVLGPAQRGDPGQDAVRDRGDLRAREFRPKLEARSIAR